MNCYIIGSGIDIIMLFIIYWTLGYPQDDDSIAHVLYNYRELHINRYLSFHFLVHRYNDISLYIIPTYEMWLDWNIILGTLAFVFILYWLKLDILVCRWFSGQSVGHYGSVSCHSSEFSSTVGQYFQWVNIFQCTFFSFLLKTKTVLRRT